MVSASAGDIPPSLRRANVVVVGAGPGGLMAAEVLATAGHQVTVYDHMPSPGRKLLMAGRGGLNLTHSEPLDRFLTRYGAATERLGPAIRAFPPEQLIAWAEELGQQTFVGTSGRVFPRAMKASPLLRAWLRRLEALGVQLRLRRRWLGWDTDGRLAFSDADGAITAVAADAAVLALGGASWPRLGSDGGWVETLSRSGIPITALAPANCGLRIAWSEAFRRFEGQPLKRIAVGVAGEKKRVRGEAVVTSAGLEGGAIYAISRALRDVLGASTQANISVDLRPDIDAAALVRRLESPKGKQSTANFLRKAAGLPHVAIGLMREATGGNLPSDPAPLAALIKDVRLPIQGWAGLERAISTAGGIALDATDSHYMLLARPGVFVAGEMLDWEAPTGGYLLQATFATAVAAAGGAIRWLAKHSQPAADDRAPIT